MTNYRRSRVEGGTYFFTVALADRSASLLTQRVDHLRTSMRRVHARHPFRIEAMVVLPDHLHAVWSLPAGDADFAVRWALIKAGFSRALPQRESRSQSRIEKRERGIWQRRYWEHLIRDESDLARHVDYIHYNPVKHGYVERAVDWPHSSLHRLLRAGRCDPMWAAGEHVRAMEVE